MKDYLFSDVTEIDGVLYFYSANNGFLEKIDLDANAEIVYAPAKKFNPIEIESFGTVIYALDVSGKYILIYDTYSGEFRTVSIKCDERPWGNFLDFFVYDCKLIIVPKYRDCMLELDPHDDSVIYQECEIPGRENSVGCYFDGKYWFFAKNGYSISSFDLTKHTINTFMIGDVEKKYIRCRNEGEEIYLLERNGCISCWDIEKHRIHDIFSGISDQEFDDLVVMNNGVVLLPYRQKEDVWIVDKENGTTERGGGIPADMRYDAPPEWSAFLGFTKKDNEVIYAMRSTSYMLVVNRQNGKIEWRKVSFVSDQQIAANRLNRGEILQEEQCSGLEFLIDYIRNN